MNDDDGGFILPDEYREIIISMKPFYSVIKYEMTIYPDWMPFWMQDLYCAINRKCFRSWMKYRFMRKI
jgi:hypothetical protein